MERFTHDKCEKDKPKKIKIKIKEKSNARNLKSVVNENDLCPICYCKTQFMRCIQFDYTFKLPNVQTISN